MKYFFVILVLPIFLLSSTGFIIQKYFCHSCNFEYRDLVLIEIQEDAHLHHDCNICLIEHGSCSCSSEQHSNSAEFDYFSLDKLFHSIKKSDILLVPKIIDIQFFIADFFNSVYSKHKKTDIRSLPPPDILYSKNNSFTILFSIFLL
jgi:hypothetical protein